MWPSRRHRIPGHEYLDGETLVSRLKKGPLPLDQVLRHACEITDALDTAHKPGPRVMGNAREASLLEDLRFKIGHGAILNRVPHLDRVAANFTVLNEGLAPHGRIQHHRDLFPAIWARKEEFHPRFSVTNRSKRLRAAIGQPAMVTLARCLFVKLLESCGERSGKEARIAISGAGDFGASRLSHVINTLRITATVKKRTMCLLLRSQICRPFECEQLRPVFRRDIRGYYGRQHRGQPSVNAEGGHEPRRIKMLGRFSLFSEFCGCWVSVFMWVEASSTCCCL